MPVYLKYILIALAVILLSSVIVFFLMKKAQMADKKNKVYLATSTVLAMICSALVPLVANLMTRWLYFPLVLSVIVSILILLALSGFILTSVRKKLEQGAEEKTPETSLVEALLSGEQQAPAFEFEGHDELLEEPFGESLEDDEEESDEESYQESYEDTYAESEQESDQESYQEPEEGPCHEEPLSQQPQEELEASFEEAAAATELAHKTYDQPFVERLLAQALDSKANHENLDAILAYEAVLASGMIDGELFTWVVVDLCALYKHTQQIDHVHKILKDYEGLLDRETRDNILRNL
jgi:hypothetical protein